jgi:hypothetical protein
MVSSNQDLISAFNDCISTRNYEQATEVGALIELAVSKSFLRDAKLEVMCLMD